MSSSLLTIGRFARLTRLSVKQLRRYDESGLLAPAMVDPETGYRLYHRRQARTATTIAMLRELDVPLAVIEELLTAGDERARELIAAERVRRNAELERIERGLAALARLHDDSGLPDVEVSLREEPPRLLSTIRAASDPEAMAATTIMLAERMDRIAPDPRAPFTALFPVDLPASFEVVLGVDHSGELPGTEPLELPQGPVATTVHDGGTETIALTWWPLLAWVHERGLEPAGPLREHYLNPTATRLAVPLDTETNR